MLFSVLSCFIPDFLQINSSWETPLHSVSSRSSNSAITIVERGPLFGGFFPAEPATPITAPSRKKMKRSVSDIDTSPRCSSLTISIPPRGKKGRSVTTTPQLSTQMADLSLKPATPIAAASPPVSEDAIAKNVTNFILSPDFRSIVDTIDKWTAILESSPLRTHLRPMLQMSALDRVSSILATCGMKDQCREDPLLNILGLAKDAKFELAELYWTFRNDFESQETLLASMRLSSADFRIKYHEDLKSVSVRESGIAEAYCNALRIGLCILPFKSNKGRLVRMALRVARCENTYHLRGSSKGKFHAFLVDKMFEVESEDSALRFDFANALAVRVLL